MKRVILAIAAVLMCGCLFTGCPKNVPVNEPELTEEEKLEQIKEVCQKFVDTATFDSNKSAQKSVCYWTKDNTIGLGFELDNINENYTFRVNIITFYDNSWQCSQPFTFNINENGIKNITYDNNKISYKTVDTEYNDLINTIILETDCIHFISDGTENYIDLLKTLVPTFAKDLYFYPVN